MIQIFVNNQQLDLYEGEDIKFTFQVNSIADIKDRQTNYTNSFSIPKTPNNMRIFEGLGIHSDTSSIPYTKPNCVMKYGGFDVIKKGWLNVVETDSVYKCHLYSGVINFFKSIENKTLGRDLDLSEINHSKNPDVVANSVYNEYYRYLIADFNGKTHYGVNDEIVNIDYLIPSVRVKYLWDKIHSTFDFIYHGEVFNDDSFRDLWLTYPKGNEPNNLEEVYNKTSNIYVEDYLANNAYTHYRHFHIQNTSITEDYKYKIDISSNLWWDWSNIYNGAPVDIWIKVVKANGVVSAFNLITSYGGSFSTSKIIDLEQGDNIEIYAEFTPYAAWKTRLDTTIVLHKFTETQINFSSELSEFGITDFVKEIINRFGLTIVTSEHDNRVFYKKISERIDRGNTVDWSGKYIERTSERYVYNGFAQNNAFKYSYDNKDNNHCDGVIMVQNKNIKEIDVAFASKTYAPELGRVEFKINENTVFESEIFKSHNKDIKERNNEKTIQYKPLNKRFFFVYGAVHDGDIKFGSEIAGVVRQDYQYATAHFAQDWVQLLKSYYSDLSTIINKSRIHAIELNLPLIEAFNVDFDRLYYFAQEQQYYLLDKIMFSKEKQSAEFIKIGTNAQTEISTPINPQPPIITQTLIEWEEGGTEPKSGADTIIRVKISSVQNNTPSPIVGRDWQYWNGNNFISLNTDSSQFDFNLNEIENKIRLRLRLSNGGALYSNELEYRRTDFRPCKRYKVIGAFQLYGGYTHVSYIDCQGQNQYLELDSLEEVEMCAQQGSIQAFGGTIELLGNC